MFDNSKIESPTRIVDSYPKEIETIELSILSKWQVYPIPKKYKVSFWMIWLHCFTYLKGFNLKSNLIKIEFKSFENLIYNTATSQSDKY